MKRVIAIALVCLFLFYGCNVSSELQPLEKLRSMLQQGNGCEFDVIISAGYDQTVHTFTLHCTVDGEGALDFAVSKPESISGISGTIDQSGGRLVYDDMLLTFPHLADGELSPVFAPWLMYRCMTGGLIRIVSKEGTGYTVTFDDSFRGEAFQVELLISEEGVPLSAELFWQEKRIIQMTVSDFRIL